MSKFITKPFAILFLLVILPFIGYSQVPPSVWVDDIGGTGDSKPTGLVTDNQNNIYVTGYFQNTVDFDPSAGVKNLTSVGGYDIYVAKYKPDGSLVWATSMGGSGLDQANCMAVDASGNVTVVGQFQSPVLNAGIFSLNNQGAEGTFIIHLDANGNVTWAKSIGGNGTDRGEEVSTDAQGNIAITSIFQNTVQVGTNTISAPGGAFNGLIVKYDASGNVLWYVNQGTTGDTEVYGNGTDGSGNIVVSGIFTGSVDFDPLGAHHVITASGNEYFVAKYSSSGTLIWVNMGSGSLVNNGSVISIDSNNDVYFGGAFSSAITFGGTTLSPQGPRDVFLVKYSSAGALQYARDIGGTNGSIFEYQMRNDPNNNSIYLTGYMTGVVDFDPSAASANIVGYGQSNLWIAKYDANGNYQWAFTAGNAGCNLTLGIELGVDKNSQLIAGGSFCSQVDFQPNVCSVHYVNAINSISDTYVAKFALTTPTAITNNVITAPSPASFCGPGDPGVIAATTPGGGVGVYTYQWQSSIDGTTFTDISGAISATYDPPALNATTFYRRVVSSMCSTALASNVISIQVQPVLANNNITPPAVTSFCGPGNPAIITASTPTGGNGTYVYQWQSSTDNTTFANLSGATNATYDPPLLSATTYYRRTVTSGYCMVPLVSASVEIIINPIPATPAVTAVNICAGSTAILSVTSPQQGVTYDWYDSVTKTNHLFTGTSYTTNVLNTSRTFYIEATGTGGCTSAVLGNAQVNVNSLPVSPTITGATAVCNGTSAILNIQNPQSGFTYNWYSAQTGGAAVFTGTTFITPAVAGNVTYYADATNAGGCTSLNRTPVNLSVNPVPTVSANGTTICPGTKATLLAISSDNNASINWYTAASGGNSIFTGAFFTTLTLNANTVYYAEAADDVTGCISATRAAVQVQMIQPLAAPQVTVSSTTVSSVTFQWSAVAGATGYQVSIDNGQTFTTPSSGSDGLTHTVSGLQPEKSVTIIVRATGSSACALSPNSTAVTGTTASPVGDQVFVANAFTPNGDGKNDIVYVRGINIRSMKFYVYDQWGELIYSSTNMTGGWDGTYKGSKEPMGVYIYYVEATMNDGTQVNKKGSITLLR